MNISLGILIRGNNHLNKLLLNLTQIFTQDPMHRLLVFYLMRCRMTLNDSNIATP